MSFPVAVPLFIPGVAVSVFLAFLFAARLARTLRTHPAVAWLLVVSVGVIVAATLTPQIGALTDGVRSSGMCDLDRLTLASLSTYLRPNETSANVVLFLPLGIAVGLLPRAPRAHLFMAAAVAFPLVIETAQLVLPALARGCESADVIDNLAGLAVGLIIGAGLGGILPRVADRRRSD